MIGQFVQLDLPNVWLVLALCSMSRMTDAPFGRPFGWHLSRLSSPVWHALLRPMHLVSQLRSYRC
jgi:ABC-type transport system involved in cytochrome c biogenesis permease subunit